MRVLGAIVRHEISSRCVVKSQQKRLRSAAEPLENCMLFRTWCDPLLAGQGGAGLVDGVADGDSTGPDGRGGFADGSIIGQAVDGGAQAVVLGSQVGDVGPIEHLVGSLEGRNGAVDGGLECFEIGDGRTGIDISELVDTGVDGSERGTDRILGVSSRRQGRC